MTDPRTCWIHAGRPLPARESSPAVPVHGSALADGDSLAFLTHRRPGDRDGTRAELGTIGFGPSGAELADVITRHIRAWAAARDVAPRLTAYPSGTPDQLLPEGTVIDKRHIRLVITYD